jgi:hypothetical protein
MAAPVLAAVRNGLVIAHRHDKILPNVRDQH